MVVWRQNRALVWVSLVLLVSGVGLSPARADDEYVGVLALAVRDDVALKIELTANQKAKLLALIETRESDAVDLATELRRADPKVRREKLDAFRLESERQGLALLSRQQRARLEGARIVLRGMAAATEPEVAKHLALTTEQQQAMAAVIADRDARLVKAGADSAPGIRAESERAMASILNRSQRAAWEGLTEGRAVPPAAAPVAAPSVAAPPVAAPSVAGMPSPGNATPPFAPGPWQGGSSMPPGQPMPMWPRPGQTPANPPDATAGTATSPAPNGLPTAPPVASVPSAEPSFAAPKPAEKMRFSFRHQPWAEVLDWYSRQAGCSLDMDAPPPGTFNYTDDREYSPSEAIDVINSVLLNRGYTLVRRDRMLSLVNLKDGIPPNMLSTISLDELDSRGRYELVRVLFDLNKLSAEEAEGEVRKLLGPQGNVVPLPRSSQILVTGTAGELRTIRRVIDRVEDPDGLKSRKMKPIKLVHAVPEEALSVLRRLFDIAEDKNSNRDGSITILAEPSGKGILAIGSADKIARAEEIIKTIDVPAPGQERSPDDNLPPQLQVYAITTADPQSVLRVIDTLLSDRPDVKVDIDQKTGNLIVLARPSDQATVKATLEQLQQETGVTAVFPLRTVDPQVAYLAITKLFSAGKDAAANAPKVDADPLARQLLVRGSKAQVAQIRELLEKMGENLSGEGARADRGKVRMVPLSGEASRAALERIQEIWPTMSKNEIRVVRPSAVVSTMRSGNADEPAAGEQQADERPLGPMPPIEMPRRPTKDRTPPIPDSPQALPLPVRPMNDTPATPSDAPSEKSVETPAARVTKETWSNVAFRLVSQSGETAPPVLASERAEASRPPVEKSKNEEASAKPSDRTGRAVPAPIIVAPGPTGVMIASEDTEALDRFEELLTALADRTAAGGNSLTVCYLRNAKAAVVGRTIDQVFGGGTLTEDASGGGGGSLLGDLATSAMGETGGGLVGAFLGLGGGAGKITPSGSIRITPHSRLNALFIQANPTDIEIIKQLIDILDRKESPEEILVAPKPRLIPLQNTQADEIVQIVKSVYQDRMNSGGGGQENRQPSPQDFMRMLRGQGPGGKGQEAEEETQKMSIGSDQRTNSVIVVAPDKLFREIESLVLQLDEAAVKSSQAVRVVTLQRANPSAVQQALASLVGSSVQFNRSGAAASSSTPSTGGSNSSGGDASDAMRRMQWMRERFGGGMGFGPGGGMNFGPGMVPGGGQGGGQGGSGRRGSWRSGGQGR